MPTKQRDLTKREYLDALERRGFVPQSLTGYVKIGTVLVSTDNAPRQTYRGKLAYLIAAEKRHHRRDTSA